MYFTTSNHSMNHTFAASAPGYIDHAFGAPARCFLNPLLATGFFKWSWFTSVQSCAMPPVNRKFQIASNSCNVKSSTRSLGFTLTTRLQLCDSCSICRMFFTFSPVISESNKNAWIVRDRAPKSLDKESSRSTLWTRWHWTLVSLNETMNIPTDKVVSQELICFMTVRMHFEIFWIEAVWNMRTWWHDASGYQVGPKPFNTSTWPMWLWHTVTYRDIPWLCFIVFQAFRWLFTSSISSCRSQGRFQTLQGWQSAVTSRCPEFRWDSLGPLEVQSLLPPKYPHWTWKHHETSCAYSIHTIFLLNGSLTFCEEITYVSITPIIFLH